MRSQAEFELVASLLKLGFNDCQVSRITGIPRSTVHDWRWRRRDKAYRQPDPDCPTCARAEVPGPTYAYLLGLYLGDGCISAHPRDVYKLRIILDQRYTGILDECADAMRAVRPSTPMKVGRVRNPGCIEIYAHWKHWPCLFPQHGPGRKHERKIHLHLWQEAIVESHPDRLLRGLIHSDGYRGPNYVNGKGYPRYQFRIDRTTSATSSPMHASSMESRGVR